MLPGVAGARQKRLDEVIATGRPVSFEDTRDGIIFCHNFVPVRDASGAMTRVAAFSSDITERKRAEAEILLRNEELHSANEELTAVQEELQQNLDELSRREQELSDKGERLRQALEEKEVLLSEIHHRVKNNLTAFISLLSLDGSYEDTPSGQALRKDLQNRARSMALIHETLYRTHMYSSVDMGIYLDTLVGQIAATYNLNIPIRTIVKADGVSLDLARATPCGLIINELVTNAYKYAFPESFDCTAVRKEPCTIRVALGREDDTYLLKISDNGIGLPASLDLKSAQSLGLKLVTFLAKHQLRATIDVSSIAGAEFFISFKA